MKKAIKIILATIGGIIAVVVVALLALPLWIGPAAKMGARVVGPKFTKTGVNLGVFELNPYSGTLRVGDLQVENPVGYSQREAFTLGDLQVEMEPTSLLGEVIHIKYIKIKDVYVSYLSKDGVNNIDQILREVKGEGQCQGDEEVKVKGQGQGEGEGQGERSRVDVNGEGEGQGERSRKVIIDRFEFEGAMVQLGPIPLRLPMSITLNDIGKDSEGIALKDAWQQISSEVMKAMGIVGGSLQDLGKQAGLLGEQGMKLGGDLIEGIKKGKIDLKSEDTEKAVKSIGEGINNLFKSIKNK